MNILSDQVVRIIRVHVRNGQWKTFNHDKLCKYKQLIEEEQIFRDKYHADIVNIVYMMPN
jgi:hypothetical protein